MFKNNNQSWLRFDLPSPLLRDSLPLSVDLILNLIDNFYSEVFTKISNQTILLQIRMDVGQGLTRSLTQFSKINYKDLDKYSQSVAVWYNFKNNHYHSISYQRLYISYKIIDKESTFISMYEEPRTGVIDNPSFSLLNSSYKNDAIKDLRLPLTLDLWNWNKNITFNSSYTFASFIKEDLVYKFNIHKDSYTCSIFVQMSDTLLLSFKDHKLSSTSDPTTFKRQYGDTTLLYVNGELISSESKLDNAYIKKSNRTANFSNKFITLDLETQGSGSGPIEHSLVSISLYNGSKSHSWYITDFSNPGDMVDDCLNYLLNNFSGYIIYIHNLSGFDIVYLFNSISKYGDNAQVVLKDDKFISITLRKGNKRITFRDSLLILPSSLSKLGKSFNAGNKIEFDFSTFDEANLNDLTVRDSLLNYNVSDCVLLFNIINSFSKLMWDLFKTNIHLHPTLTSIAFSLYRSKFMAKPNIPLSSLSFYNHIKEGYTGGAVDCYRPRIENGFYYDVNSLYPTVMRNNPYPVGRGVYFKGTRPLSDLFGIVHASITSPDSLFAPILMYKDNNTSTAPLGSWSGWYFTGELQNAVEFGYQVTVHEGYHWPERDYIFKDYVDTLYTLRLAFDKQDPRNLICKLLMNSLYGRFGLSPHQEEYSFKEIQSKVSDNLLVNKLEVGNNNLFGYLNSKNQDLSKYSYGNNISISLPISLITSAYARMFMSKIKMKFSDYLYYSDTDSVVTSIPLPPHMVGSELGQFKLEHKISKGVFLCPKVYGLILEDGSQVIKVKGSTVLPTFEQLEQILDNNSPLPLSQNRWTKNFSTGKVYITDMVYNLMLTENKRKFVYDNQGKVVATTPILINK